MYLLLTLSQNRTAITQAVLSFLSNLRCSVLLGESRSKASVQGPSKNSLFLPSEQVISPDSNRNRFTGKSCWKRSRLKTSR